MGPVNQAWGEFVGLDARDARRGYRKEIPCITESFTSAMRSQEFDCAQVEYTQCMQYLAPIKAAGIPTVFIAHDVSYISQERKAQCIVVLLAVLGSGGSQHEGL